MSEAGQEPVVAFRVWYTCEHPATATLTGGSAPAADPGLYSVALGIGWNPGVNEAVCRFRASTRDVAPLPLGQTLHRPGELAPVERCACGMYSYGNLETARRYRDECHEQMRALLVLGAVRIWGKTLIARVTDHSGSPRGPGLRYRSQFAEVLAVVRESLEGRRVADRMGVPAVAEAYLEPYARELGQQLRPR